MKLKHPTYTSLILDQLRAPGVDFMDVTSLVKSTGCTRNQAGAALHFLRKYRCIDVVVNADGKGWWFALSEDHDTRQFVKCEIAYETKPRKSRKKKEVKREET